MPAVLIESARNELRQVRELLSSARPSLAGACAPLERAAASLRQCLPKLAGRGEPNLEPVLELHGEITQLRSLLDYTASFYAGWRLVLGGMQQGYRPGGRAAGSVAPAGHVLIEG